jgi:hypothetical protein
MLLAMMGNTGVLNCYGVPRPEGWRWRALALGDPRYRGEVWRDDGAEARIAAWSPNRVVVDVAASERTTWLMYNMHHFRGWRAELEGGGSAMVAPREGLVAAALPPGTRRVTLRYRPPGLETGLALAGCAVLAFAWRLRRERRGYAG